MANKNSMNSVQKANLKQNMLDMLTEIRLNELNIIDAAKSNSLLALRELQQNDRELTGQFLSFTNTYKKALRE